MRSFVLFFFFLVPFSTFASDEKSCDLLLQQSQGDLAGQCFSRLAQAQGAGATLDSLKKRTKGLFLEKAAKGYDLAGQKEKDRDKSGFFYEEGAKALKQILDEKLCLKTYQCQATRGMLLELTQKIGYSKVTLTNPKDKEASVGLRAYQFQQTVSVQKQTTLSLRPGRYELEVNFPGQPPAKIDLDLAPNTERVVAISGTLRFPTGAWVLGGIGLGIAAVGGLLVIRTFFVNNELRSHYQEVVARSSSFKSETKEKQDATILRSTELASRQEAETRVTFGAWVAFGAGSAMTLGGLLWLFFGRTSTKPGAVSALPFLTPLAMPLPPPPPSQTTLLFSTP